MFNKNLLFAASLLLLSCGEEKAPAPVSASQSPETPWQKIGVPFVREEVYVPKDYVFTSKEEITSLSKQDSSFVFFATLTIPHIWDMQESPFASALYRHPTEPGKMVFLVEWDKVPLDQGLAKSYVYQNSAFLLTAWKELGCTSKILEGNYIETDDKTIIKSSYRVTCEGTTMYTTNYVITNRNQTFYYFVVDTANNDLETLVRKI